MSISQFAKISPIVDTQGYLLTSESGYTLRYDSSDKEGIQGIRLKEHEIGICLSTNSLLTMHINNTTGDLEPITLGIVSGENIENILETHEGVLNGQIVVLKDNPTKVYTIVDNKLYLVNENCKKSVCCTLSKNNKSINLINSDIQECVNDNKTLISGKYIVNSVILLTDIPENTFIKITDLLNNQINIFGSTGSILYINKECYGLLNISLYKLDMSSIEGDLLNSIIAEGYEFPETGEISIQNSEYDNYSDDSIFSINIEYTPILGG